MNKRTLIILSILLVLLAGFLFWVFSAKNDRYSWYKSYTKGGKEPYDLLLFERILNRFDKNQSIDEVKIPFSILQKKIKNGSDNANNLFVHAGNSKSLDYESSDSLISFARMGNRALIFEEYGDQNIRKIINQLNGFSKRSPLSSKYVDYTQDEEQDVYTVDTAQTYEESYEDSYSEDTTTTVEDTYDHPDTSYTGTPQEEEHIEEEASVSISEDTTFYLQDVQYTDYENSSCVKYDLKNINFKPHNGILSLCYYYDFKPSDSYFYHFEDSLLKKVPHKGTKYDQLNYLGFINKKPFMIEYKVGKGSIIICTQPMLVTNYFLKEKDGYEFINVLFKDYKSKNIYYNKYTYIEQDDPNNKNFTPLKYILSQEPLKWAFYIFVALLIVFFIFFSKRKQKLIPVINSKENSTIEYVETISRLYQSKKANRDILEIMSKNFFKFIQHKYQIKYTQYNEQFEQKLTKISGIDAQKIKKIFDDIETHVNMKTTVSNQKLNDFYNLINHFYKNCK